MRLQLNALFVGTVLALSQPASASTWNTFAVAFNADHALYFFDADSVVKDGDTTTLWVKYV